MFISINSNLLTRAATLGVLMLGTVLLPTGLHAAGAQGRDTLMFKAPPSVQQMGDHLFPTASRGVVFAANKKTVDAEKPVEKSVGLPVLFHFGKTTLVDASKPYLDKIGELMQAQKYEDETLVIEGHTDAVGSDTYNYRLSELRALAVKDYLVASYGIDPLRLFPVGQGERLLVDASAPNAQINRRVEFLRYDR